MNRQIDGREFRKMIVHAAAAIGAEQEKINDLNVFPVPDGDTGTNMYMTVQTAATDVAQRDLPEIGAIAQAVNSAMLRGARGNSGVILSLLFRGISKSLKGKRTCNAAEFAEALNEGVRMAYGAVMKPAEGTILTVSRLAAKRAAEAAAETDDLETVFSETIREAERALADTVEQNPVLKKAGVVDAGGMGFAVILRGMYAALKGEPMPQAAEATAETENRNAFSAVGDGEITYTFDTVFYMRKSENMDMASLRAYLSSIGDSLVIGEDDECFKIHVHTDTPGAALNEAQKYGVLELAKIENMRLQYEDAAGGKKPRSVDDVTEPSEDCTVSVAPAEKPFGFLAVCAGEGLAAMFRNLGADAVVSGGQTMNPSTESILNAVNTVPAETVFVLPNNKNIIMAAQQCVGMTEKNVVVIPTETVPQGIGAMVAVDFTAKKCDGVERAMNEARTAVSTVQVTYAARNSEFDGISIREGDYLALLDGKLMATARSVKEIAEKIAKCAAEKEAEFLSIYFGSDVTKAEADGFGSLLGEKVPEAEISVFDGGQPVYYYIIAME